jgi:hypothetical protein
LLPYSRQFTTLIKRESFIAISRGIIVGINNEFYSTVLFSILLGEVITAGDEVFSYAQIHIE